MRLIDADALVEHIKKIWGKWEENDWYEVQAKDAMKDDIKIVNRQPTVDAVTVVRCKNCKHYRKIDNGGICVVLARGEKMTDDWFCKDGERREE